MSPSRLFCFRPVYFFLALFLFGVEVIIAVWLHDPWIRPYGGDFLVVILLYCFARSFVNAGTRRTALAALLVSYAVETGQYFHLILRLGLEHSRPAQLILGYGFSWVDLLMYTLGFFPDSSVGNMGRQEEDSEENISQPVRKGKVR